MAIDGETFLCTGCAGGVVILFKLNVSHIVMFINKKKKFRPKFRPSHILK